MLKKVLFLFIVVIGLVQPYIAASQSSKPNIVLFFVDDMGWQDTSVPFWKEITENNRRYHTPNMERLAQRGMKFTNAYSTPVCTPTRVSLMTGMNAAHHQVTNWTHPKQGVNSDKADSLFSSVPWNIDGMSPVPGIENTAYATPLPQLLHDAGYYTIHCGKAHFASMGTPAADPLNIGFQVNIAGSAIGHPASYLGEKSYGNIPVNGKKSLNAVPGLEKYYDSKTFLTEALTIEALKALKIPKARSQPFFLYMAHYAIHSPLDTDERFIEKYLEKGLSENEAAYAALIEGMDKSLGDIMDWLDKNQLTDNTVILFMSDNGPLTRVPPRSGIAHTQNAPLRAGKGSVYEGGIREPMIVSWPGVVKPGSVTDSYLIIEDFFPTLLDIAGADQYETVQKVDGQSFLSLLKGPGRKNDDRVLIWHYPNKWIPEEGPAISWNSALRQGDWKLVYKYKNQKAELYNLKADISEQHDLSLKEPGKTLELRKLLTAYLKRYGAQLPINKITGKAVCWPDATVYNQ